MKWLKKKKTSWAVDVAQGLGFKVSVFFVFFNSALAYPLVWETLKIKQDVKNPSYHWMQRKK